MAVFTFDQSYALGRVRAVDTRRVSIQVDKDHFAFRARLRSGSSE